MGEKDFYEYWSETYKTHTLGWSPAKAKSILTAWQASFGAEVRRLAQSRNLTRYDINAFSSAQLDTIMEEFSEFSWTTMAIGYAFMVTTSILLYKEMLLLLPSDSTLRVFAVE